MAHGGEFNAVASLVSGRSQAPARPARCKASTHRLIITNCCGGALLLGIDPPQSILGRGIRNCPAKCLANMWLLSRQRRTWSRRAQRHGRGRRFPAHQADGRHRQSGNPRRLFAADGTRGQTDLRRSTVRKEIDTGKEGLSAPAGSSERS